VIIVHNDFHETHALFSLFDGLSVKGLDRPFEPVVSVISNGPSSVKGVPVNGDVDANGLENIPLQNGLVKA
jgi:methylenetetrahydrofolate reductase (NADPH)